MWGDVTATGKYYLQKKQMASRDWASRWKCSDISLVEFLLWTCEHETWSLPREIILSILSESTKHLSAAILADIIVISLLLNESDANVYLVQDRSRLIGFYCAYAFLTDLSGKWIDCGRARALTPRLCCVGGRSLSWTSIRKQIRGSAWQICSSNFLCCRKQVKLFFIPQVLWILAVLMINF